jgi:hypothetical protein
VYLYAFEGLPELLFAAGIFFGEGLFVVAMDARECDKFVC